MSDEDTTPPALTVTGGDPTAEEWAAASAVLSAALDELVGLHRRAHRAPTAWERNRRALRQPLPRNWNSWAS